MSNGSNGFEWAFGYGYARAWEQLHRTEEAVLVTAETQTLVAEAARDLLRLHGSNIANRDQLLDQLDRARSVLAASIGVGIGVVPTPAIVGFGPPFMPQDAEIARRMVGQVRRAINEYRDERRNALIG